MELEYFMISLDSDITGWKTSYFFKPPVLFITIYLIQCHRHNVGTIMME